MKDNVEKSPRRIADVACPYCKAASGAGCVIDRRNVSIAVTGYHKPRVRRYQNAIRL